MPNNGAYNNQAANAGERNVGAVGLTRLPVASQADPDVLFHDTFDDQPDWHSGLAENNTGAFPVNGAGPDRVQIAGTHTVPEGWYAVRQDPVWAPSTGHPDRHEAIEILASNSDKTRSGTGKSYVSWRDSTAGVANGQWNSDSILAKYFPGQELTEVFVRIWIRFGPNWTPSGLTGQSKLFRLSRWDGEGDIFGFGSSKNNGPVWFWDYEKTSGGVRNFTALRGHPIATNYGMANPAPLGFARSSINQNLMEFTFNFDNNIRDLNGDGTNDNTIDTLLNLQTGLPLAGIVEHDEVYGDSWRKVEFYAKMNSAPGVRDGVVRQWIDDDIVVQSNQVPWMGSDSPGGIEFNIVAIGGNDYFHAYPDSDRREEWYAIDEVLIRSSLPEDKL